MDAIAFDLAACAARNTATSAWPNAPVLPDPGPSPQRRRLRIALAAFLQASALRRVRLADRVEPDADPAEALATRV
jgi:hypothetical protein